MKRIQHKLLILLISVALIPIFIIEYFTYQDSKTELEKANYIHLNTALTSSVNAMSQLFSQNSAKPILSLIHLILLLNLKD